MCKCTCYTSSAYHVQHVLRTTWYEGTAQLLSLTELKSHSFELYFIGWTISRWRLPVLVLINIRWAPVKVSWHVAGGVRDGSGAVHHTDGATAKGRHSAWGPQWRRFLPETGLFQSAGRAGQSVLSWFVVRYVGGKGHFSSKITFNLTYLPLLTSAISGSYWLFLPGMKISLAQAKAEGHYAHVRV